MAASITGVFKIIDRASAPMKRMESQALKTMAAIEGVGAAQDKASAKTTSATRAQQNHERQLRNVERQAKATERGIKGFGDEQSKAERSSRSLSGTLSKLNSSLGGVGKILTVLKFAGLAVGVTALAQAIGTLAGGVVALIPQLVSASRAIVALPTVVGAAVQGLLTFKLATSGVSDALKAGITLQKQSGQQAWDSSQLHMQAAQNIQNAERSLYLAQRQSTDAQVALNLARRQAKRDLTDMALAARSATLAEQRSRISQREAKLTLQQTLMSPTATALDIQSARLGVSEAGLGVDQARVQRTRAQQDNARAQKLGVNRSQTMIQATRAVADAAYEQTQATKQLAQAQAQANHDLAMGTSRTQAYTQAMKNLSPAARSFVRDAVKLRPQFDAVRTAASEGLFPGARRALNRSTRALPMARRVAGRTGRTLGNNIQGAVERFTTKGRLGDLEAIGNQQNRVLDRMLRGLTNVGEGFVDLMRAAEPFTEWLTKVVYGWTRLWQTQQRNNRESGVTAMRLVTTRKVLTGFFAIAKNVWTILKNIGKAATPLGNELWKSIRKATKSWADWTGSVEGKNRMTDWFNKLKAPLDAMAKIVVHLAKAWARLTVRPEFTKALQQLDRAIPGIEKFMGQMSNLGPGVATLLSDIMRTLGDLPFSPLKTMLGLLDKIVKAVDWLIRKVPGLGTVLSGLLLMSALSKATGLVKKYGTAWEGVFRSWRRAPEPPMPDAPMSPGTGGGGGWGGGGGGRGGRGGTGTGGGPGARRTPYRGMRRPPVPPIPPVPPVPPTPRGGRFGRGLSKLKGAGGVAGIAALIGADIIGGQIGGAGGGALSGAATGVGIGATVGSVVPIIGTAAGAVIGGLLGGGLGFLSGRKQDKQAATQAGLTKAQETAYKGSGATRSRIGQLQRQLAVPEYQGKAYGTMPGYTLDAQGFPVRAQKTKGYLGGNARKKAQTEYDALKKAMPKLEVAEAPGQADQMAQVFGIYQGGNAAQRRKGRGQAAKLFKEEFAKAGPEGKRALGNSVGQWIEVLSKGDKSQRRMARTMTQAVKDSWGDMGRNVQLVNGQILGGSQKEWGNIRKALKDPVEKAKEDVSKGFTAMQKSAIGSLVSMGYTRAEARGIVSGMEPSGNTTGGPSAVVNANTQATRGSGVNTMTNVTGHAARGGRIRGVGLQDTVPVAPGALAAPGELIVNRHTEHKQDAINRAVGAPPLGKLVGGESRPHSATVRQGIMPGFAKGGRVGDLGSMVSAANAINAQHYPYVWGGGHNPAFTGPYDCSGSVSAVLHAGGILSSPLDSTGFMGFGDPGPGAVTLFASPSHVYMAMNGRYFGTSTANPGGGAGWFDGAPRPGFVQRHVPVGGRQTAGTRAFLEMLGASGGGAGAGVTPLTTGIPGAPGAMGDAALAAMASALNDRIGGASSPGMGTGTAYSGGGNLDSWLRQALQITHHYSPGNLSGLRTMAMGESGGRPDAIQQITDINSATGNLARGLLQVIPPTFATYHLPGHNNIMNPVDNAIASVRYQYSRYGKIVGHAGYEMGGRVPDWGGWNARGGSFNVSRPTLFGAGESGDETVHIVPKGKGAAGAGGGIHVEIGTIHNHREGDVAAMIKKEFELLAQDIDLVGAGD